MEGKVILEVTSADIPGMLDALTRAGITVAELFYLGPLSVRFQISRQDVARVQGIIEVRGESWKQLRRLGLYWKMRSILRHWVLVVGLLFLVLLTAWIPTKILFIQVSGNDLLPSRLILENAASCGIQFGADRGTVRSEQIKNSLLEALPQLEWVGVNTTGCVAVITVRERHLPEATEQTLPGNIVAIRDGILLELTADRGTAVAKPGQAVRAGEILISGYTDCGGVILLSGAKGEAYGQTRRIISAVTSENQLGREEISGTTQKISLVIGKKRINFNKGSGILDTGCVKMYLEYYITLPGGWKLPVKLVIERSVLYDTAVEKLNPAAAELLLEKEAADYLRTQMIAGRILTVKAVTEDYRYQGEFVCREMIGRLIHEEIVTKYGEDH